MKKILFLLIATLLPALALANPAGTFSERVYVQTDKPYYVAGQPLLFRFSALDANHPATPAPSKVGYLLLRNRFSETIAFLRMELKNGCTEGRILLPDTLQSGSYQLVGFTRAMRNQSESSYFAREILIVNRLDKQLDLKRFKQPATHFSSGLTTSTTEPVLSIETDLNSVETREAVKVRVTCSEAPVNLSVSVYEELPESLLKQLYDSAPVWKADSLSTEKRPFTLPEHHNPLWCGRVVDTRTGEGVENVQVLLSCLDSLPNLLYATTSKGGQFALAPRPYHYGKEWFLTLRDVPEHTACAILPDDASVLEELESGGSFLLTDSDRMFLAKSQKTATIQKSYPLSHSLSIGSEKWDASYGPWVYQRDVTVTRPSEFVSLDHFREIDVELLPTVGLHEQEGKVKTTIRNYDHRLYGDQDPAIFLDGVLIDDARSLLPLGSSAIRKIEVIDNKRVFGDLVFDGILSVVSTTGTVVAGKNTSFSLRRKDDLLPAAKASFQLHPNDLSGAHQPCYPSVLYWNPEFLGPGETTAEHRFIVSDQTGRFVIEVTGLSVQGVPFRAVSHFTVHRPFQTTMP